MSNHSGSSGRTATDRNGPNWGKDISKVMGFEGGFNMETTRENEGSKDEGDGSAHEDEGSRGATRANLGGETAGVGKNFSQMPKQQDGGEGGTPFPANEGG